MKRRAAFIRLLSALLAAGAAGLLYASGETSSPAAVYLFGAGGLLLLALSLLPPIAGARTVGAAARIRAGESFLKKLRLRKFSSSPESLKKAAAAYGYKKGAPLPEAELLIKTSGKLCPKTFSLLFAQAESDAETQSGARSVTHVTKGDEKTVEKRNKQAESVEKRVTADRYGLFFRLEAESRKSAETRARFKQRTLEEGEYSSFADSDTEAPKTNEGICAGSISDTLYAAAGIAEAENADTLFLKGLTDAAKSFAPYPEKGLQPFIPVLYVKREGRFYVLLNRQSGAYSFGRKSLLRLFKAAERISKK